MKNKIASSEITPEHLYASRRRFLKGTLLASASLALAACSVTIPNSTPTPPPTVPVSGSRDEMGDPATPLDVITSYNNFYEFSTSKNQVANLSGKFMTSPWQVTVGGLVRNPGTYDIDDLRKKFDQEERIYRLRCVEGWSMVIPWMGFSLAKLLKIVEPKSEARYVRFESVFNPEQMPGQKDKFFPWPYVEGLTIEEAVHDLTILSTGVYGKPLLPQNGAPVRLVVPWKYGFKSIKSIVKIDFVTEMPTSLWMASAPQEYGFFANVNPEVSHPRWSQSSERRLPDSTRRATLKFNGYQQVINLYKDLDLNKWY